MKRLILTLIVLGALGCTGAPPPVVGPPLERADVAADAFALEESVPRDFEVVFFAVGTGDSTLLKCPDGRRILIDAGSLGGLSSAEETAVRAEIRSHIGDRVDVLVVSHPDSDHYNLLADVLQGVPVSEVIYGGDRDDYRTGGFHNWLRVFEEQGRATSPPDRFHDPEETPNGTLSCGGVDIWILAANVPAGAGAASNFVKNTPSVVLRVQYGEFGMILAADATTTTEAAILAAYPDDFLAVHALKLGHHGSRTTSTGWDWAATTRPRMGIASTSGGSNPYGHPNGEILLRLAPFTDDLSESHDLHWCAGQRACGTAETREAIYSTSSAGTIVLRTDGQSVTLSCDRSGSC
jgi:beta-lactamase superfamily II metal-dependent hydrolase